MLGGGRGDEARQEGDRLPAKAKGALRSNAGWQEGATEGLAQRQGYISSEPRDSEMGEMPSPELSRQCSQTTVTPHDVDAAKTGVMPPLGGFPGLLCVSVCVNVRVDVGVIACESEC